MVPGSTLRYGSSFWSETLRWRAFRMFPSDAAVIPLPSEETTPPVTKTYFDIGDLQGGFSNLTGSEPRPNIYLRRVRLLALLVAPTRPISCRTRRTMAGRTAWPAPRRGPAPSLSGTGRWGRAGASARAPRSASAPRTEAPAAAPPRLLAWR